MEGQDFSSSLPAEILCLCFTFLPDLRACFAVSHVSRSWKTAALAYRALWSDIELGPFKKNAAAEVLCSALVRSGQHPVDVVFESRGEGATQTVDPAMLGGGWTQWVHSALATRGSSKAVDPVVVAALSAHMHHIRRIDLPISTAATDTNGAAFFARAAPFLEELCCDAAAPSDIESDFLGGVTGRLRTLSMPCPMFPLACPALATVTHLTTTMLLHDRDEHAGQSHVASFSNLFELCPRLVELSITNMLRVMGSVDFFPKAPAPESLHRLSLSGGCNVLGYLPRFQGLNTPSVELSMPISHLNNSVPFLEVEQAVELQVQEPFRADSARLSIRRPLGAGQPERWTDIVFPMSADSQAGTFGRIAYYLSRQRLAHVERIAVPLAVFTRFIMVLSQCDSLTEVRLIATQDKDGAFPWKSMQYLTLLRTSVVSVVLEVLYGPGTQPTAADVLLFLEHLHRVLSTGFGAARAASVKFVVRGFPVEMLRSTQENIHPTDNI